MAKKNNDQPPLAPPVGGVGGVGLRYIGNGAFLPGLPARDLGAADLVEYATLIGEMEQAGTLGALYEWVDGTDGVAIVEEGVINA